MLVLNRALQETLEQAVFDQYHRRLQTRIDTQTPAEMRWLVMFPKLAGSELGALRERFGAVASISAGSLQLARRPAARSSLAGAARGRAATPLVLMIGRGRLTLRTALAEPELPALAGLAAPVRDRDARGAPRRQRQPGRPAPQHAAQCRSAWGTSATLAGPARAAAERRAARSRARRQRAACLPSSILAIALRCTSSGPSAKRSVRAAV